MNGFIEVPNRGRRFPYIFEDQCLTIYSRDSLLLSEPTDLGIISSNKCLIASNTETSALAVFFVDEYPFDDNGPILWTSTSLKVYFYIDGLNKDRAFTPDKMCFSFDEPNYFFNLNAGMKRRLADDKTQTIETLPYEETKKEKCICCIRNFRD